MIIADENVEQYWIDIFGKVALTGESIYYENYLETLAASAVHKDILKSPKKLNQYIQNLTREMNGMAMKMEFERAAELRDQIKILKDYQLNFGVL